VSALESINIMRILCRLSSLIDRGETVEWNVKFLNAWMSGWQSPVSKLKFQAQQGDEDYSILVTWNMGCHKFTYTPRIYISAETSSIW
jgi:hypothetical protein